MGAAHSRCATIALIVSCLSLLVGCAGPPPTPPRTPPETLNAEGVRRLERGDLEGAEDIFHDALHEAELVDDLGAQGEAWSNLGASAMARGRLDEARGYYVAALQRFGALEDDVPAEVTARTNLGAVLLSTGRPDEAVKQYEYAAALAERLGERKAGLLARIGVAASHLRRGDGESAARLAGSAGADAKRLGEDAAYAAALTVEAGAAELAGALPLAKEKLDAALAIDRRLGNPNSVLGDLQALARVARKAGDVRGAALLLGRYARVARNLGLYEVAETSLREGMALGASALTRDQLDGLRVELEAVLEAKRLEAQRDAAEAASGATEESHVARD